MTIDISAVGGNTSSTYTSEETSLLEEILEEAQEKASEAKAEARAEAQKEALQPQEEQTPAVNMVKNNILSASTMQALLETEK